jgi:hypothetical protein
MQMSDLSIEQARLAELVEGLRQELAALKAGPPAPSVMQFDPSLNSLIAVTECA